MLKIHYNLKAMPRPMVMMVMMVVMMVMAHDGNGDDGNSDDSNSALHMHIKYP